MKFKQLLKRQDVTQQELADKLGIHQTAISKWCTGQCAPSVAKIVSIAQILACSVEDVVNCFQKNKEKKPWKNQ